MSQDYASLMHLWNFEDHLATAAGGDKTQTAGFGSGVRESAYLAQKLETSLHYLLSLNHDALRKDILGRIHAMPPKFFEALIIDVMLKMGYGARRRDLVARLGKSHDGGIDGMVPLDALGLDTVFLQAKRLKPGTGVPVSDVRDFVGSLDARHATKGVFFSTGYFTTAAISFCASATKSVVLVDGRQLSDLMIRHNIGVGIRETYQIKRIDEDYFYNALQLI